MDKHSRIIAMYEIPLFPLNTVLFPGMPINLHIFEDRYKKMILDCTLNDSQFGVVLIDRGEEAHGPFAVPYSIGCIAKIIKLEPLDQGKYNLTAIGKERFKTSTIRLNDPYLVGEIEDYPIEVGDPSLLKDDISILKVLIKQYLAVIHRGEEVRNLIRYALDDPLSLGYLGSMILQIPDKEKQVFLETKTSLHLIRLLQQTYRREIPLQEKFSMEKEPGSQGSFSLN